MAARRKAARGKKTARKKTVRKKSTRKAARSTKKRAATRRKKAADRAPSSFPEVEELVQLMDAHGLLEVDYATQSRRIRESAETYSAMIAALPAGPGRVDP